MDQESYWLAYGEETAAGRLQSGTERCAADFYNDYCWKFNLMYAADTTRKSQQTINTSTAVRKQCVEKWIG